VTRTPPTALLWLAARLHPELRRRNKAARWALTARPWRDVAARWFEVERHEWHAEDAALQAIDPSALTRDELIDHLRACRALVVRGYRRHLDLHGDDMLPFGLLLARCAEWGIDAATAARALDGASPLSAGTVAPEDWQLITGYDLDGRAWIELGRRPERQDTPPALEPLDLHPLVPMADHEELDALVADARTTVPLRDDNSVVTAAWPMGLLRRAMLEAGRLIDLPDAELAVEMTVDELVARLGGSETPPTSDIEARRDERARNSMLDAPLTLGPEPAIPPLTALPRPLALVAAAQLMTAEHMITDGTTTVGIGTEPYTGRALVVDDPASAMATMEPGDVVITRFTSPSWNSILVYAGALVTTTGGLLSHAATIARELGIPAVIGDASAIARITSGDFVTVDPVAGTVRAA
jgi:pyruvate,water dikinase